MAPILGSRPSSQTAWSQQHARFGLAFCEASGPRLVRRAGNDTTLVEVAVQNALAIGAGHSFVVFLRDGFPVNVLNQLKAVPEVCHVYCATANPVQVLVAHTSQGRGILGVDGEPPLGVENDDDERSRKTLVRDIGYAHVGMDEGADPFVTARDWLGRRQ